MGSRITIFILFFYYYILMTFLVFRIVILQLFVRYFLYQKTCTNVYFVRNFYQRKIKQISFYISSPSITSIAITKLTIFFCLLLSCLKHVFSCSSFTNIFLKLFSGKTQLWEITQRKEIIWIVIAYWKIH